MALRSAEAAFGQLPWHTPAWGWRKERTRSRQEGQGPGEPAGVSKEAGPAWLCIPGAGAAALAAARLAGQPQKGLVCMKDPHPRPHPPQPPPLGHRRALLAFLSPSSQELSPPESERRGFSRCTSPSPRPPHLFDLHNVNQAVYNLVYFQM